MNIPLYNKEGHVCERITTEAGFTKEQKKWKAIKVNVKNIQFLCALSTLLLSDISQSGVWVHKYLAWISHTREKSMRKRKIRTKN